MMKQENEGLTDPTWLKPKSITTLPRLKINLITGLSKLLTLKTFGAGEDKVIGASD